MFIGITNDFDPNQIVAMSLNREILETKLANA
jgi:hypothetical protein